MIGEFTPALSEWWREHQGTKALHMVGRTVPALRSSRGRAAEVEVLRESLGYEHLAWTHCSTTQRLDLLATEIIRMDRAQRRAVTHRHATVKGDAVLTQDMARRRYQRELTVPDLTQFEEHGHTIDRSPVRAAL